MLIPSRPQTILAPLLCLASSFAHAMAPLEEFTAIAESLQAGSNGFYGLQPLDDLQAQLEANDSCSLPPEDCLRERIDIIAFYIEEQLRVGDTDAALALSDEGLALVDANASIADLEGLMQYWRGVIHLRLAELLNCVQNKSGACCQFPLTKSGVHKQTAPAQASRDAFLAYLDTNPTDLDIHWIVNILSMALDDYPEAVPPAYLVAPEAFVSDFDIQSFPNAAAEKSVDAFDLAGGMVVDDFNADGFLDMISTTSNPFGTMKCFLNDGQGGFTDASAASGLDQQLGGMNCTAADYDNDGDVDVYVMRGAWMILDGQIRNSLLRNNGSGVFEDVTHAAGLASPARPSQVAVWADIDNDGDLDLFVGNESSTSVGPGADFPCQLFENNGDGTFTDIAVAAGVTNDRYTKAAAFGDYDNDGDMDLFVSNMGGPDFFDVPSGSGENRLYRNNGDNTFTDVASAAGVIGPNPSFSSWFFDYDNDGWLDLMVTAYDSRVRHIVEDYRGLAHGATPPRLYHNNGDGTFTNVASTYDLDHAWRPMGTGFGDLDNDGWLDFYLTTGTPAYTDLMPNAMLRNNAGLGFQDVTTSGGFGHLQKGHGVAFADIDNDGDQDVIHQQGGFVPSDGFANAYYRNPGHGNNFLVISLIGVQSNHQGHGVRIRVDTNGPGGPRSIHRAAGSFSSFGYLPVRQEIGLGDATTITSVHVEWPKSGTTQNLSGVEVNSYIQVTEGVTGFAELDLVRVNAVPVANTDTGYSTGDTTPIAIPLSEILANDIDSDDDTLTFTLLSPPLKGNASVIDDDLVFDPLMRFVPCRMANPKRSCLPTRSTMDLVVQIQAR